MTTVADNHGDARQRPWERWRWTIAVVWLVFLYFPVSALRQSEAPAPWQGLAWAAIPAFAVAYVVGLVVAMRQPTQRPIHPVTMWCFLFSILFAALTIPAITNEALGIAPFIMAFAAFGLGGWWHGITSGVCFVIAGVVMVMNPTDTVAVVIFCIVALMVVVLVITTWLIRQTAANEKLNIQLATSRERAAIARDVHDLVGHTLTVVRLKADLAEKMVDRDPERAKAELAEIAALTAEAIASVRSTVTGIRASNLDEQLTLSQDALRTAGITVTVEGEPAAISPAQALTASWILREATTNVLRHAEAEHVTIRIAPGTVVIEDDGKGIGARTGNGLNGMSERAHAAGAQLTVEGAPSQGTRVEVRW